MKLHEAESRTITGHKEPTKWASGRQKRNKQERCAEHKHYITLRVPWRISSRSRVRAHTEQLLTIVTPSGQPHSAWREYAMLIISRTLHRFARAICAPIMANIIYKMCGQPLTWYALVMRLQIFMGSGACIAEHIRARHHATILLLRAL